MAMNPLENIRAASERVTFTHRDSSDFTSTVTLDRQQVRQLLAKMNEARAFMRPLGKARRTPKS